MRNNEIILNTLLENGIYTEEEINNYIESGTMPPVHTFSEWKRRGYNIKRGSHGIVCYLWKYKENGKKLTQEEKDNLKKYIIDKEDIKDDVKEKYFIKVKTYLFLDSQVEKRGAWKEEKQAAQKEEANATAAASSTGLKLEYIEDLLLIEFKTTEGTTAQYKLVNRGFIEKKVKKQFLTRVKKYAANYDDYIAIKEAITEKKEKEIKAENKEEKQALKLLNAFTSKSDAYPVLKEITLQKDENGALYTVSTDSYTMIKYDSKIEGVQEIADYPNVLKLYNPANATKKATVTRSDAEKAILDYEIKENRKHAKYDIIPLEIDGGAIHLDAVKLEKIFKAAKIKELSINYENATRPVYMNLNKRLHVLLLPVRVK